MSERIGPMVASPITRILQHFGHEVVDTIDQANLIITTLASEASEVISSGINATFVIAIWDNPHEQKNAIEAWVLSKENPGKVIVCGMTRADSAGGHETLSSLIPKITEKMGQ